MKVALCSVPSCHCEPATVPCWASEQESQALCVHPKCHANTGELFPDQGKAYHAVVVYNMDRKGGFVCGVKCTCACVWVFARLSFPTLHN